jgi:hypothetical protein
MTKLIGTISDYAKALKGYVSPTFQGRVLGVFCTNSWIFVDLEKIGFRCFYRRSYLIV